MFPGSLKNLKDLVDFLFNKYIPTFSQVLVLILLIYAIVEKFYIFSIPLFIILCFAIIFYNLNYTKRSIHIINKESSILIRDKSGRSVHYRTKNVFRVNYPYFSKIRNSVFADGTIANFTGSLSVDNNSINMTIECFSSTGGSILVEQSFPGYLEKHKKYNKVLEFDFIDSYIKKNEYHLFSIRHYIENYSFSVIFPPSRYPQSINCIHNRRLSKVSSKKEDLTPSIFTNQDFHKEYNWKIKNPPIGDDYKVEWTW